MRFPVWRTRRAGWITVAVLSLTWLWAQGVLGAEMADPGTLGVTYGLARTAPASGMIPAAAEVPDSVLQTVASAVTNAGNLDELVVLPDPDGGYQVSATVQLGYDGSPTGSALQQTVAKGAEMFFSGLYSSGVDVRHAEIYWMAGGELVAGAGLGAQAYTRLASAAAANTPAWWQALSAMSAASDTEGTNECWAEVRQSPFGSD